jgi:hypothetical protein
MMRPPSECLAVLWRVNGVEANANRRLACQNFKRIAVNDLHHAASEVGKRQARGER